MNTKAITEGGLFCGIAVIMALISYYIPFLLVFYVFTPLPIVFLSKRHGFITALIASIAASIILFFFIDWMDAVLYAMYLVLVGCSLGYTYYKNCKGLIRIAAAYITVLITLIGSLILIQKISGVSFIDSIMTEMQSVLTQISGLYSASGLLSAEQLGMMSAMTDTFMSSVKLVLPTALLMTPALIAWCNVLLSDKVLGRFDFDFTPLKPISQWRMPQSLKIFLIVLIIGTFFLDLIQSDLIPEIYLYTITEIVNLVFVVMGLSFCFWFFNRKKNRESTGVKVLIVILTLLISPIAYLLSLVGIADSFIRLREIITMMDKAKGDGRK